jgi:hypothetical protein
MNAVETTVTSSVVLNDKPAQTAGSSNVVVNATKLLAGMEAKRISWEQGAYRTSNLELYNVLAECLLFSGELPVSESKQRSSALEGFFKARGYTDHGIGSSVYNIVMSIISDQKIVSDYFIGKGFKSNEFSFGAVNFQKKFREIKVSNSSDEYIKTEQVFDGYEATQSISFSAKKNPELMKRIEEVSNKTSELINSGIELTSNTIQYTYSDLPSLKQSLIENATKDASQRANKIVNTADGDLGKLKDASMGVFQITGQGSTEEDSYGGNNDQFSKNKTARITVRLQYELK